MPEDFLGDRKKALEESFFAKESARLVERLRAQKRKTDARVGLAEISGIEDEAVIDKLVDLGVEADTWAAVSLVPLVEVAWADGMVDERERRAVLSAAEANGVANGSPSYLLLESWLERRPDGRLLACWGEYMVGVCSLLGAGEREALKHEIIGRARAVAEAAGGILGLGNRIAREESVVLSELEKAFEG